MKQTLVPALVLGLLAGTTSAQAQQAKKKPAAPVGTLYQLDIRGIGG